MFVKLIPALALAIAMATSATAALALESSAITELNVRTGPGNTYRVLGKLQAGDEVDVDRCAQNGWCYVMGDDLEGWAYSKYLAADEDSVADADITDDEDFYDDEFDDEEDFVEDDFYGNPFHQRFGLFFGPGRRWRD
jgi:hypothetical protein